MRLFFLYIKQRRRGILLLAAFVLIFLVSFLLYHLPLGAVLYPAILCLLLGAVALAADFFRVREKHRILEHIRSLTGAVNAGFPPVDGVEDADYQEIIRLICEEQTALRTAQERRYGEMLDYYTVWAHQIKTPIAAMRLNLQNEDSALSRRLSADLMRIEQYVEMVLMFLRLDSHSSDYVIREQALDPIVRGAVKKFAGEFIGRKLSLDYQRLDTRVLTDEKWLSFVVEQVLSNALKYTPSGGIAIFMARPGVLCVRDTGIGIAPEDLPRIFEQGFSGGNGRSDKRATGIGLYLCRRVCANLGHRIWAEAAPDQGTAIYIDLNREKLVTE